MNITYIHQYFKTPDEPGGTRSYWISQELIRAGHTVTMITSGPAEQVGKIDRKNIDGINVIYIRNPYDQRFSVLRRLISFISFMFRATRVLFRQKNTDLVIATSTPLTVGIPPMIFKSLRKKPYLFEVRDLWPEVPIQMGALNNSAVRTLALKLESVIYKNAMHIIALSPGMQEGVVKVVADPAKVSMVPNMAKNDKFWRRERNEGLIKKLKLRKETFKLIHFGAMGRANGLDYILDAAKLLKENNVNDVEIILLGDGSETDRLVKLKEDNGLDFVHFPGAFNMAMTSEIVNLCDASIVPFLNLPVLKTNSPNKLFDSLSAGVPIIVNSDGWTKEMVEVNECGAYVNPDDPSELCTLILEWKENKELLDRMGKNARKLAETTYDKSILCKKFVSIVHSINNQA